MHFSSILSVSPAQTVCRRWQDFLPSLRQLPPSSACDTFRASAPHRHLDPVCRRPSAAAGIGLDCTNSRQLSTRTRQSGTPDANITPPADTLEGHRPILAPDTRRTLLNHKRYGFKLTRMPSAHVGGSDSGSGTPSGLGPKPPIFGTLVTSPTRPCNQTLRPVGP